MDRNVSTIIAFLGQNHNLEGPMKLHRDFFGVGAVDGISGDNYDLKFKYRLFGIQGANMIKQIIGTIDGKQISYDVNNTFLGDLKEIVPTM